MVAIGFQQLVDKDKYDMIGTQMIPHVLVLDTPCISIGYRMY